ncbi:MAG: penicillin acylase family protein [Micrococcales bacterium]|nr:penicillin acylase family protein [Micrococcales bacterium]
MSKTVAAVVGDAPEAPTRPRLGRRIGLIAYSVFVGLVVLALVAAGVGVWFVNRSFPQAEGTIALDGLSGTVTVQRSELGIPTITAGSTDDLFFAQGYVHAQDRFWEMDFRRHVTSGRLSELFGESQVGTDAFLRTLGWRTIAEQEVAALDETTVSYYQAYADGVNAYLANRDAADVSLEYAVLGLQSADYEIEPWTPADSVAWLKAMAWDLRSNIETETERALLATDYTDEELLELYPPYPYDENPVIVPQITDVPAATEPAQAAAAGIRWSEVSDVVSAVSTLIGDAGEGIGSNSWVVAGDYTDTGMPLLANDPHLGASLPSVWYQAGLRCAVVSDACPFDVAGFSFSGVPGIIIGHNASIAWGFTNLTTDVVDLYIEKLDGEQYWRDGQLVDLDTRTETLKVAGGEDVELTIRSTVHGPIISGLTSDFDAIAADPVVGTAGATVTPTAEPEGESAVSIQWTALQPGTTATAIFELNAATDFTGFRAAAEKFVVPAQNLIYADTTGNIGYQTPGQLPIRGAGDGSMPQPGWDSAYDWQGYIPFAELPVAYNPDAGYIVTANNAIVDQNYPYFLTRDWDDGWRAARIDELLQRAIAEGPVTAEVMRGIQADNQSEIGKTLITAFENLRTGDEATDAALDLLRQWDALHAITLTHETFGTSDIAPIEALFNRGPFPVGGGSSVVNATGWPLGEGFATTTVPSMRMVVDLSDFDASGWNHLTGASGHAFHENYTDQTATWQAAGLSPWAFSPDAVTAATEHTLTLEPAN